MFITGMPSGAMCLDRYLEVRVGEIEIGGATSCSYQKIGHDFVSTYPLQDAKHLRFQPTPQKALTIIPGHEKDLQLARSLSSSFPSCLPFVPNAIEGGESSAEGIIKRQASKM